MDKKNNIMPSAKQLRTVLIIMWSILGVYLIIKLLGGNWFEIVCKNERFISVCEFLDKNFVPRYLVSLTTSLILYGFLYLAILRQWKFTKIQFIIFIIYIPIQCLIKNIFMTSTVVSLIVSFVTGFIIPIILYKINGNKITWKFLLLNVLLSNVFDLGFQVISALVKNLGVKTIDDNTLISLIFIIDVFIMETLYYLYCNKIKIEIAKADEA